MVFITRFCKKINILLGVLLLFFTAGIAQAEDIGIVHAKGAVDVQGRMFVSTRFNVRLPSQLSSALQQGVSLNFRLAFSLDAPTYTAYKTKVSGWFSDQGIVTYKLSYHPLTKKYRVSIGSLAVEDYPTLSQALNRIGGIADWNVLPVGTLKGVAVRDIQGSVRLSLTMDDLPKPFQIDGLTARKWDMDTSWVRLAISRRK